MGKNTITVGFGTPHERELEIKHFVQAEFKDERLITMALVEDDSIVAIVENPKHTGRTRQDVWLSKETAIGFMSMFQVLFGNANLDFEEEFKKAIDGEDLEFRYG